MRHIFGGTTALIIGFVVLSVTWTNASEMIGFHHTCKALDPVGVHLSQSGMISYVGTCGLYPYALPAFTVLTIAGLTCVGAGIVTVRSDYD